MNKITLETKKGAYSAMHKSLEEAIKSVLRAYGCEFKLEIKSKEDE